MRPRTARPHARRIGAVLAAAAAAATVATVTAPTASAVPIVYPAALTDGFYNAPADLADKAPGEVLAVRSVPPPALFFDTTAVQLKFRSTNSQGAPIAAVTTVLSPTGAAPARPVLSFQHIVNALGLQCAPSQALYTSDPNLMIREAPALNGALQQGWSVAIPDHLGPTSAYGAARLGGQITLDGIRAVKNHTPLALTDSPVGLAGYSGGGMATAMAAALAPTYAPELELAGSAFGGAPLNIGKMAKGLGDAPHPVFGLAMAAAMGLEREYPQQMPVSEHLNPEGVALRDSIANACTNDIIAGGAGRSIAAVADTINGTALLDDPSIQAVFADNSVEALTSVPNAPIYEWHANDDVLIPVDAITSTMRRYCDAGVPVQSESVWSPDHLSAAVVGLPGAISFLTDRFAGVTPTSNC
ncbi:lipase (plasmid) [Rhodococcus sp. H-CA8f]|uniref:Lipase family protein n=1 Tax=Rhodococcus baikonurensis TaxID=172041 RepID=A0ABV5XDZ0_9NOCA|nr:lipase family protein [Rhodococcus sp. H-CA8f]ATI36547.1 lipase [Rhodococcus sp. H-CA8f]